MMHVKLRTTYALTLDVSTYNLLRGEVLETEEFMEGRYDFRFERLGNAYCLSYVVSEAVANEYAHKAVHRWLRKAIKSAKAEKAE